MNCGYYVRREFKSRPDGTRIASGTDLRALCVWDLTCREPIARMTNHTDEIHSATFSPDGTRLVSASVDGSVKVWDVDTWSEITTLDGYGGKVNAVVFSPDGSQLIGGLSDGTIKVWLGIARGRAAVDENMHAVRLNLASRPNSV
jgi:WD40 repeat protein